MNKKLILLLPILLCFVTSLSARHIIGGVVSYVCNGNGNYTFTMKVYRDCYDPQAAGFDYAAAVTFYKGDSQQELETIFVEPQSITDINPPEDNPCIEIPATVCVEEGIYVFDYTFSDWPSTERYSLAYQRCCRNNNITNVFEPESNGATFSTVILPAAQAACNNSPVFDNFPPIVLCAGEPFEFDHQATDIDGDVVIYELCAPLKGGGLLGTAGNPGNVNDCEGVSPNPACSPATWENIGYVPPYSALNPLGGSPPVTINSSTGLLSGTPLLTGQYVVGVCATEYRNGELMSVLTRDFQFNVLDCQPLVDVNIVADSINDDGMHFYSSCSDSTFFFENNSTQQSQITNYFWNFDINGTVNTFNEWEPTITFPGSGTYEGQLLLNPGQTCGDTANIKVEIYPAIEANFDFTYDTCQVGPVEFSDITLYIDSPINKWDWDFGNGVIDTLERPFVLYDDAGLYDVALNVTDENGCKDDTIKQVSYFPVPNLIVVSPSSEVLCPPATVIFENLSFPIDDTYTTNWQFGDGGRDSLISPTYTYDSIGLYDVSLEIISPVGCLTDTVFEDLILVKPAAEANFAYEEKAEWTNFDPDIQLFDLSDYAIFIEWLDNGERFSMEENPYYAFPDTGIHQVQQVVYSREGCIDTMTQYIDVKPEITYYLPNAFTPNWDTKNDEYGGKGFLRGISNFEMQIWNRWGELVFQTTNPDERWNGQKNNNGSPVPSGTYVCHTNFTGPRGEDFQFKSYVLVTR